MCGHGHSGKCAIGIVIAIIFGALFLWFLVHGYILQTSGTQMLTVYSYYFVALIMAAIAKLGMHLGHPHHHECGPVSNAVKKK
ncbi:MAG: hypothetical protein KKC05_01400 [Nanoarchaeota archaeon]|nr:hypothetical protein [Nanoarchaeota archaeon]